MLAYLLALTVGLGSFALYMAAFFFPEVHRKNDFIWSGVGLFYALVLWVCAGRITGGVLLGQTASVTLLGWLGWQTLLLRRQVAPVEQQTAVPTSEELKATVTNLARPETVSKLTTQVSQQAGQQFDKLKTWGQARLKSQPQPSIAPPEQPYVPLTPADFTSGDRPTAPANSIADSIAEPSATTEPTRSPKAANADKPDKATPGLGSAFQQMLGGANKKRESKPVYVRKQFREPEAAEKTSSGSETAEVAAIVSENIVLENSSVDAAIGQDTPQSSGALLEAEIAYETNHPFPDGTVNPQDSALEAIPPHPPAPELVEAALADAEEKHLPAAPPVAESDRAEPSES